MYCPQCGQQQVQEERRFCSRCGFPLGGVLELLATGGLIQTSDASGIERARSPRREGVRQGTLMILLGIVLVPLVAIFSTFVLDHPELFVPPTAIIFFLGGLIRIIYALIFQEGELRKKRELAPSYAAPSFAPARMSAPPARAPALPPAQSTSINNWRPPARADTSELVAPPSVTEQTTRLLDEKIDPNKS